MTDGPKSTLDEGRAQKMARVTVSQGRRNFLTLAALGAPAAIVSAATDAQADEAAPAHEPDGYRKSEHVKKYLETARF
ncbi:MAG: hypothetical protein MRY74_00335 [Neomegalonema sp.]|nr:hypothetical protein [Neomegalonema sp.]